MPCRGCKGRFNSLLQSMTRTVGALSDMIHSMTQHAARYKRIREIKREYKRRQGERIQGETGQEGGRGNVFPKAIPLPWPSKRADVRSQKTKESGENVFSKAIPLPWPSKSVDESSQKTKDYRKDDSRLPAVRIPPLPSMSKSNQYRIDSREKMATTCKGQKDVEKGHEILITEIVTHLPTTTNAQNCTYSRSKEVWKLVGGSSIGEIFPTLMLTKPLKSVSQTKTQEWNDSRSETGKDGRRGEEMLPTELVTHLTTTLQANTQDQTNHCGNRTRKGKVNSKNKSMRPSVTSGPPLTTALMTTTQDQIDGTRNEKTMEGEILPTETVTPPLITASKAKIQDLPHSRSKKIRKLYRHRKDVIISLTPAYKVIIKNYTRDKKGTKSDGGRKDGEICPTVMVTPPLPSTSKTTAQDWTKGIRVEKIRKVEVVKKGEEMLPTEMVTALPMVKDDGCVKDTRPEKTGNDDSREVLAKIPNLPRRTSPFKENTVQPIGVVQNTLWESSRKDKELPSVITPSLPFPSNTEVPGGTCGNIERKIDINVAKMPKIISEMYPSLKNPAEQPVRRPEKTEEEKVDREATDISIAKAPSIPEASFQTGKAKEVGTTVKSGKGILLRFPGKRRSSLPLQPDPITPAPKHGRARSGSDSTAPPAKRGRGRTRKPRQIPEPKQAQQCRFCGYFTRDRHMFRHFRNIHQGFLPDDGMFRMYGFIRTAAPLRSCPADQRPPDCVLMQLRRVDMNWLDGPSS